MRQLSALSERKLSLLHRLKKLSALALSLGLPSADMLIVAPASLIVSTHSVDAYCTSRSDCGRLARHGSSAGSKGVSILFAPDGSIGADVGSFLTQLGGNSKAHLSIV